MKWVKLESEEQLPKKKGEYFLLCNDWISVSDELPPMNVDVLIYTEFSAMYVASRKSYPTGEWKWRGDYDCPIDPEDVSHWMKLPGTPNDCEHEEGASIEFIYKPPHVDNSPIEFFDLPKILHHEEWINLPHILHEDFVKTLDVKRENKLIELKEYIGKTLRHIVDIIPSNSGEPTYVDFDICISYEGNKIVVVPGGENASRIKFKVRIQG